MSILYLGRFQPFHLGHMQVIDAIINHFNQYPIIAVIRGSKSVLDKEKNPFDFETQKSLIHKIFPSIEVGEFPNGYLPDILKHLNEHDIYITNIVVGSDRATDYDRQLKVIPYEVKIFPIERFKNENMENISGSKVRECLKNDDYLTYKTLMPEETFEAFERLKKFIKL